MGEQVLFWCVFFTTSGYFQKKSHKNMIQENYNTPHSTPQAIPLASYERNPFIACWERFRGVFQRCGETTLDMYRLLPRQLTCPPEKLEVGRLRILSFPIELVPFLVTYQISLGNNLPGRNLGNMTQCFEKKLDVSQKSEGEPFSQKAMKYSPEN